MPTGMPSSPSLRRAAQPPQPQQQQQRLPSQPPTTGPQPALLFASSNTHKYEEARRITASMGIDLGFLQCDLEEIQSHSLTDIARHKARGAFAASGKPVMVEDDGLFVDGLGGFPGPYSSYVFQTIGNEGILALLAGRGGNDTGGSRDIHDKDGSSGRAAKFLAVIAYCDGATEMQFCGTLHGSISTSARGKGWGYDPVFVPSANNPGQATMAELGPLKDGISHRHAALGMFSSWWRLHNRRESSGR